MTLCKFQYLVFTEDYEVYGITDQEVALYIAQAEQVYDVQNNRWLQIPGMPELPEVENGTEKYRKYMNEQPQEPLLMEDPEPLGGTTDE